ncbi:DUF6415 family natural product biosynthesis protein [Streptomyces sp. NPDC005438]|uniref:DUF6415 family natural product biosynthesis protein n=1 Tax=Streptomyces sp. NPDC005438 TaxID=3156880 RepID=UPI0033A7D24A
MNVEYQSRPPTPPGPATRPAPRPATRDDPGEEDGIRWRNGPDTAERLLRALSRSFADDVLADVDQLVNEERGPHRGELRRLAGRMPRNLERLLHLAAQRATGRPGAYELLAKAGELARQPVPRETAAARGHLRRMALYALDLIDLADINPH